LAPIPPLGENGSPLAPGISDVELATDNIITIDADGNATTAQGEPGTATFSLPELFQFPSDFLGRLRAEVIAGHAKILTDPTLIVQEGETANVNLVDRVITNVTTETTITDSIAQTNVNFEEGEVGLLLSIFVDRIDDNGFVTMEVSPVLNTPGETRTINTGIGEEIITLLNTRELTSGKVRLRDGQTLILAGVISDAEREQVTKWPLLGDIPIIGALFRGRSTTRERSEVVIVVTPQILDDSDTATFGYGYTPSPDVQEFLERNR
jgi:type IV pilus assembly protein PilQ